MGITPENFLYWPSCNYDAAVPTDLCKCVGGASLPSPRVFFLPFPQNREPVQRLRFFNTTDALSVTFWLPSVTRERWEGGWVGAGCHVYKNQVH